MEESGKEGENPFLQKFRKNCMQYNIGRTGGQPVFMGTLGVLFKKGKEGERMSGLKPTAVRKQCGKEPKTALKLVQRT